jgi:hypothetical protein
MTSGKKKVETVEARLCETFFCTDIDRELREHYSASVIECYNMIGELMNDKTRMGKEISQQKA